MQATSAQPAAAGASRTRVGLKVVGLIVLFGGFVMAAMPFVGPLIGVQFDAYGPWEMNRNRLVLHVLPGLLAAATGAVLLLAHHRTRENGTAPGWLPLAIAGALVVGVWNGAGPWLLDLVLPASDSGLMFLGITHFHTFSIFHQLTLEAVCHWIPGMLPIIGAAVAYQLWLQSGRIQLAHGQ